MVTDELESVRHTNNKINKQVSSNRRGKPRHKPRAKNDS